MSDPSLPDDPTGADSDRDGAFSYAGEWHAFTIGAGVGVATALPSTTAARFLYSVIGIRADSRTDAMREAKAESWYAVGGLMVGLLLGMALYAELALLAYLGYTNGVAVP
jgi:uncharacterized protein YfaA (DUF2138 family)